VEAVRKIITEEMTNFIGFPPKTEIEGNYRGKKEERRRKGKEKSYITIMFLRNL